MNDIFAWTTCIFLMLVILLIIVAGWRVIIDQIYVNLRNTWWITSWILHTKRRQIGLKRSLVHAMVLESSTNERKDFMIDVFTRVSPKDQRDLINSMGEYMINHQEISPK